MLKKFPSDKRKVTKMPSFLFRELQLITILLLICDFYMRWSARFATLKLSLIFDSVSFLSSLYFCSTKCMDSLTLTPHNSFQNWNNRKATHSFAPRPLSFKLPQEVLKFNDICVSWSSQKTDLVINFLNLENRSFENIDSSQ